MNLIDLNIMPDPFNPKSGDTYEYGDAGSPRVRIVVSSVSFSDMMHQWTVDFEVGGEQKCRSSAGFPCYLASLPAISYIGRIQAS